ncbi:hypothetical protein FQR65_LT03591 [Abscondita terminalis]|nr:hypothetical protein FQR65_LT03591 [Abscondita terminalis]
MRAFVLVATLVAIAQGRPEAGYSYKPPSSSYGAPGGGHSGGISLSGGSGFGVSGGGFGVSGGGFSSHGSSIGLGGHGGGSIGHGGGGGIGHGGFGGGDIGFGGGGDYHGGSSGAVVQKHIYVHVPPPEPEEYHPPRHIPVAPAQKHYKIIFIKAPSPPTPTVPVIPVQPQNEEKTLVYVLVKKPEEAPEIHIPQPAPTQPSKPEVYFIRYKTQKDHGGSGLISGGGISGGGISGGGISGGGLLDGGIGGHISGGGISGGHLDGGISGGHISGGSSHISGGSISGGHISGGSHISGGVSSSYGPPGKSGPY